MSPLTSQNLQTEDKASDANSSTNVREPEGGFGKAAMRGGAITAVCQFSAGVIGYALTVALAWYLTPHEFGLIVPAQAIAAFIGVFREAGMTNILIQRQGEFQRLAKTVFWLSLGSSVCCAAITVLIAPIAAMIYRESILVWIMLFMAFRFVTSSFGLVSSAKLTVDLRWRELNFITLTTVAINAALQITMAHFGYGVFCIIVPPIIADIVKSVLLYRSSGVKLDGAFSTAIMREILSDSVALLGSSLTVAARNQGAQFILSLMVSTTVTGRFYYAFTVSGLVLRMIGGAFIAVLLPVFAKIHGNEQRVNHTYQRALHALVVLLMPLAGLQIVLSQPLLYALMPGRWHDISLLIALLTPIPMLTMVNSLLLQPLQAARRYRTIFRFDVVFVFVEIGLYFIGASLGSAQGIAIAAIISAVIGTASWHAIMMPLLRLRPLFTFVPLWRCVVSVCAMMIVVSNVFALMAANVSMVAASLIAAAAGLLVYLAMVYWLHRELWNEVYLLAISAIAAGKKNR